MPPDIPTERPSVLLRLLKEEDAAAFSSLINQNHEYLREWLPWVGESSDVSHELEFINACSERAAAGMEFHYAGAKPQKGHEKHRRLCRRRVQRILHSKAAEVTKTD
jgi:hypothetical protein